MVDPVLGNDVTDRLIQVGNNACRPLESFSRSYNRDLFELISILLDNFLEFLKDLPGNIQPLIIQDGSCILCFIVESIDILVSKIFKRFCPADKKIIAMDFNNLHEVIIPCFDILLGFPLAST